MGSALSEDTITSVAQLIRQITHTVTNRINRALNLMPGLDPGIHAQTMKIIKNVGHAVRTGNAVGTHITQWLRGNTWIRGSSPRMRVREKSIKLQTKPASSLKPDNRKLFTRAIKHIQPDKIR